MKITYDENGNPLFDGLSADEWLPSDAQTSEQSFVNNDNQNLINQTDAQQIQTKPQQEETKQKEPEKQSGHIYLDDEDITNYKAPKEPEKDFWGEVKEANQLRKAPAINSIVDAYRAVGFEAMKPFMKAKEYEGKLSALNYLPSEKEYEYKAQTQFGGMAQVLFRYIYPYLSMGFAGGATKSTVMQTANKALTGEVGAVTSLGRGNQAVNALINNGLFEGLIGFTVGRPDEGEGLIGDILPNSKNPIVKHFQTNTDDSGLEWRIKNAEQNSLLTMGAIAGVSFISKLLGLQKAGVKQATELTKATNPNDINKTVKELAVTEAKSQELIKTQSLIESVQDVITKADDIQDVEDFLNSASFVTNDNKALVKQMFEDIQAGKEIIPNTDGSYSIKVTKWQDAADVSMDELKAQTNNDGISLMNNAVKDVWNERGLLGANEDIVTINPTSGKASVNTKAVSRVLKYYEDKFGIKKPIKVEWYDGKIQGADATTPYIPKDKAKIQALEKEVKVKQAKIKEIEQAKGEGKFITPQDVKKEMAAFIDNPPKLEYVNRTYKGKFWKQLISDPETVGYVDAENQFIALLKEIKNNPLMIKNEAKLKGYEDKLQRILNIAPTELEGQYSDRFYQFIKLADKYDTVINSTKNNQTYTQALKSAQKELQDAEGALAKYKEPQQIVIKMNKYSADPYATLRSELEHARDITKGTVPKDKHFSRYNGMNESEASLEYIRYKASNRKQKAELDELFSDIEETKKSISPENSKYTTETNLREAAKKYNFPKGKREYNGAIVDVVYIEDKNGNPLGYMPYSFIDKDTIYVDFLRAYRDGEGIGRAAVAQLMQEYPDKQLIWYAVSEKSIGSYQKFLKEYPEFAKRVEFEIDKQLNNVNTAKEFYNTFDNINEPSYNTTNKGVINEGSNQNNTGQIRGNLPQQGMEVNKGQKNRNQQSLDNGKSDIMETTSSMGKNKSSNSAINERGKTPSDIDNRPISERQQSLKSIEEANQLLEDDIKTNGKPDVRDWKVNLENADVIYAKFMERGIDNTTGIKEAISKGDVEYVNMVVEKQLAAERRMSDLKETLLSLPETEYKKRDDIINSIFQLQAVSKDLASAYGRGLNAQRLVRRVNNIFQLSTMQELGIEKMADLLSIDIKNLNFTRGTESAKQQLYQALSNDKRYGKLLQDIFNDVDTKASFDDLLDKIVKQRITNPDELQSALRSFADPYIRRDIIQMLNYCTDDKLIGKIVANAKANRRFDNQIGDYVVNNLLSNPKTTIMNVTSGVLNTGYFPLIKILGSRLGGGEYMAKEGLYTLKAFGDVLADAWKMGVQAFKTGEGKMINLSRNIPTELDADKYKAFYNLDTKDFKEGCYNLWTIMTRTMGASDEFLTQLNYRANVRAKALIKAEEIAEAAGKSKDINFVEEQAAKFFNEAFDATGRPLDVQAYAEARDIVYQTPLSGKYWDFKTGSYTQVKEQSLLMKASESLTRACMNVPVLKVIFPFVRTPSNIGQMALEHNALYNMISPNYRKTFFDFKSAEGAKQRAKVSLGLLSEALAYNLAAAGLITGSPPRDAKERAALYKTGWRPYSFKKDNKYYSYAAIEPISTIFGFAADVNYIATSYDNNANIGENLSSMSLEALQAIVESTFNKASFTNGINQFDTIMSLIQGTDEIKEEQVLKELQKFLPLSSAVQSFSTVGKTEATNPYGYQAIYNKYLNRGLGDYKRNVFGERQDVYNYLLATGVQGLDKDLPEDEEIMRLAQLGWSPTEITAYESNSTVKYKDFRNSETGRSLYDAMCEEMTTLKINNKTLREAVRELISSKYYQAAVDGTDDVWKNQKGTKVFMLRTVFNNYKKAAKNKVLNEQGHDFVNKDGLDAFGQRQQDRQEREAQRLNASLETTIQNIRSFS